MQLRAAILASSGYDLVWWRQVVEYYIGTTVDCGSREVESSSAALSRARSTQICFTSGAGPCGVEDFLGKQSTADPV